MWFAKAGVSYTDAQGGDIPNRGEILVEHVMDDKTIYGIHFQDGKAQMPIISVRDLVKRGSSVKFKNGGGTIKLDDGRHLDFKEMCGVYLIDLNVLMHAGGSPEPDPNDDLLCGLCEDGLPDFGRPG